jgi:hypothetical protein
MWVIESLAGGVQNTLDAASINVRRPKPAQRKGHRGQREELTEAD